ncbi:MAG TPA: PD-(D/E)XK nuclease family protein, partial [Fusibacter sp.]|nr:PD-(D/E)XK nuclease family protein [Fusibacter sp.]
TITDVDIYHSRFQYQYMINKLKRVSKKAAWTLTQQLASGAFVPTAFEVAFGDGPESVAPILVSLTNGERLLIRGVIDRVDTVEIEGKKYIKIIDYKSGRKSLSLSDIYNGLQMQLMVYLSACMDNPHYFRATEIAPAGAFYFRIDDPFIEATTQVEAIIHDKIASELKLDGISLEDVKVLKHLDADLFEHNVSNVIQVKIKSDGAFSKDSKIMPIEAFEGMIKHVEETIRTIGDELLEGKIDVSPCKTDGFVSCQYCDFKSLCQFDRHFEGNAYRTIKSLSNEDVIEKLKG